MKYYPVLMDVNNRHCLVVGAGPVGERKAKMLSRCGARVTMVSPEFSQNRDELEAMGITCIQKEYQTLDLQECFMVFATTNKRQLNTAIQRDAQQNRILCNVADGPDDSDFILPSVVHRGDLILAASTSGNSPALAKKIRKELESHFGPEYEMVLTLMGQIRKQLLKQSHAPDDHKKIFYTLIESGLIDMVKNNRESDINALLKGLLGSEYNYKDLVSQRSTTHESDC